MGKVLISFLGTGNYEHCNYYYDNNKIENVRFVQESIIKIFCKDWTNQDKVCIFTTKEAIKNNWIDTETSNHTKIKGLESTIKDLNYKFRFYNVEIPSGTEKSADKDNVTKSIWKIFEKVNDEIKDGDELIFDITHAFRYIPMLGMILLNYTEVIKNIKITGIYYGAYEVLGSPQEIRQMSITEKNAPIINLISFSILQKWTNAASSFLQSGNTKAIEELTKHAIKPILKDSKGSDLIAKSLEKFVKKLNLFTNSINMCRGDNILKGQEFKDLNDELKNLSDTFIYPLNPILDKIKIRLSEFDKDNNISKGLASVKWCIDNNLIQQGITLLDEICISVILIDNGFSNYNDKETRNIIKPCVEIKSKNLPEEKWEKYNFGDIHFVKSVLQSEIFMKLYKTLNSLTDFRNDINHAGFRENSRDFDAFKRQLEKTYNEVKVQFEQLNSNHP